MNSFWRGFGYAAKGIVAAVREERNLRFHLCTGAYVFLFSLFYDFGKMEYLLITVLVAGVLALELVNSALERHVDCFTPEHCHTSGYVKDVGAGAVLVFCVGAAVCGVLLFWDIPTFLVIFGFFASRLWLAVLLAASLFGAWWFVFRCFRSKEEA